MDLSEYKNLDFSTLESQLVAKLPNTEIPDRAVPDAFEIHVTDHKAKNIRRLLAALHRKKFSALALYEPLEHVKPLHERKVPEKTLRGSNRSGKTLAAAVELARAVTGQDPYKKYPKKDGRAFVVGKDGVHIGTVLYRKLFRAGAFYIIRDEETGLWRNYKPWSAEDEARKEERKPAPPLIPPSMVKEIGWENKREEFPRVVRLKNGWEIHFFTALGKPPQGQDLDYCWFDEEIPDPSWYPEMAARLIDRGGKFVWSATPQAGSDELFDLHEQAIEEQSKKKPRVIEIFMHVSSNPHMSDEDRQLFASKIKSEQERRIRIEGEFALRSFTVYPEFNMSTHGCDPFPIPNDWTRFAVIDPGRQVLAVLFAAVPPEGATVEYEKDRVPIKLRPTPGQVFLYDELYLQNASAEKFGDAFFPKVKDRQFYAFIIDHQGSRVRDTGSGLSIEDQYAAQLKQRKIKSRTTGHGFQWGATDVDAGIERVRSWLDIRDDGTPVLQVFNGKLEHLYYEFQRYRYARDPKTGLPTDKPDKRNDHLMDALRYLAMYAPKWYAPAKKAPNSSWAHEEMQKKRRMQNRELGSSSGYVRLGPGVI